jgi:MoxR-like ATPase
MHPLRERIQGLVECQHRNEAALGEALSEAHDFAKSPDVFCREFGYADWDTYIEEEIGIRPRTAQQWIRNHRKLVIECGIDQNAVARMGQTKAEIIARVITPESRDQWLTQIWSGASVAELKQLVKESKQPVSCSNGASGSNGRDLQLPGAVTTQFTQYDRDELPPKPHAFVVADSVWKQLCYAVLNHQPVLLTGPSGCGKTELIRHLAEAFGRELCSFDFGQMQDPRASLLGLTHLEGGKTVFRPSRFLNAVASDDSLILLDELSRCETQSLNMLCPLLDGQGYLSSDEDHRVPVVRLGKQVRFFATANMGESYVGTHRVDKAVLERFVQIRLDFPDANAEKRLIANRFPGVSDVVDLLVTVANDQREQARDGKYEHCISTRLLLRTARQAAWGIELVHAIRFCILNSFDNGVGDEAGMLEALFQSHGIDVYEGRHKPEVGENDDDE